MSDYPSLLQKVDNFITLAEELQRPHLRCAPGCDDCCRLERNAFQVEIKHIRAWLQSRPALLSLLRARSEEPTRCCFLNAEGRCDIYPVRPIICRSHGPALRQGEQLLHCALNFEEGDPETLPPEALLNLDLLNTLLMLINQAALEPGEVPRAPLSTALQ